MATRTEYDTQRAKILLRDLDRLVEGNAPAVSLHPANAEVPCLHGDATHAGLLRLALDLARIALFADHSTPIRVTAAGEVRRELPASEDTPAEVLRLELVDDRPTVTRPSPRAGWLDLIYWGPLLILATLAFAAVGLVHTVKWLQAWVAARGL